MIISVKDLAKYLRDSVSFDFSKETISSYDQIRRRYDDFFALEDEKAFVALLNDIIGADNQLIDVFVDLRTANRGFRYFANSNNRSNPYSALSYFLSDSRFEYHKNDLGRVYIAINTWLNFYGAPEMATQWNECPLCASPMSAGVCTNKTCKKKENEFIPILLELQSILQDEQQGLPTDTPTYYKLIKEKSQFGEYKQRIDALRTKKKQQAEAQERSKKALAIAIAEKELKKIEGHLALEAQKEAPNFEVIANELSSCVAILEAMKYGDPVFNRKVEALKIDIQQERLAVMTKAQNKKDKAAALAAFNEFAVLKASLDNENANRGLEPPIEAMQKLVKNSEELFACVNAANTRFPDLYSAKEKAIIADYQNNTIVKATQRLEERIVQKRFDEVKNTLISLIEEIKKEYERCKLQKDGAKELMDRFIKQIEQNPTFLECRADKGWDTIYAEITAPVKADISKLLTAQTNEKINSLLNITTPLIEDVCAAKPKQKKSWCFRRILTDVKNDRYYDSIRGSKAYKQDVSWLEKNIDALERREIQYFKRKRTIITVTSIVLCSVTIIAYMLFGYILPLFQMEVYTEKLSDERYTVIGVKDEQAESVTVSEYMPDLFLRKNKRVSEISDNAFRGQKNIKRCTLPATIERIGENAFRDCTSLKVIVLKSNKPPKISKTAFQGCKAVFLVPVESYAAYMQDKNWSALSEFIFPDYYNSLEYGTVMFDSNGGNEIATVKSIRLNTVGAPLPTPEREGHTFTGWFYRDYNGDEIEIATDSAIFQRSTKLYARWDRSTYSISFVPYEGSDEIICQDMTYGQKWTNLPEQVRKGYTFQGWYLGEQLLDGSVTVEVTEDTAVHAKWLANVYTVTLDYAGGEEAENQLSVTYDSPYGALPNPVRTGYAFGGWVLQNARIFEDSTVATDEDHVLVAQWIPNAYVLKYEANGGNLVGSSEMICYYDQPVELTTAFRTGYTFSKWLCNGQPYDANAQIVNLSNDGGEYVFEAVWTPNEYTLRYDARGGTVNNELVTCVYDVDTVLETPTRKGYTFLYWSYASNQYSAGDIVKNLAGKNSGETVTLSAVWQANEYTIRYALMGGTQNNAITQCKYDVTVTLETPAREGYEFLYWVSGSQTYSAGETVYNLASEQGASVELVAVWEAKNNTVYFHPNTGTGEMSAIDVASDSSVVLPANEFTKEGYTFIGWSQTADGAVTYKDGDTYQMDTEAYHVLYAVWQANENTLFLFAGNGTQDKQEIAARTDDVFALPANEFVYDGYRFAGWCMYESSEILYADQAVITMPADNITILVAAWIPLENTVIFDANGGTGSPIKQSYYTDEVKMLTLCSYIRSGYSFAGWSTTPDGDVNYTDGANYKMGATPEVTLYAVWTPIQYSIVYHLDGGLNHTDNPTSYTVESGVQVLLEPIKAGYTFAGWYMDEDRTQSIAQIDESLMGLLELYAKWTVNTNTIYFMAYGGDGEMTPVTAQTDQEIILPACGFTKAGYSFIGWSITPGGDVYYSALAPYVMGPESEYTLYASWKRNTYSIGYVTNGGTNDTENPTVYHVESADITLKAPIRAGYTFGGWYEEETMTTAPVDTIPMGTEGNKTYYAKWIANTNVLHFDANGGSGIMEDVWLRTGDVLDALPEVGFERVGYHFAGWALSATGNSVYGNKSDFEMGVTPEITLYAVWTNLAYSISYDLNGGTNNYQNPVGYEIGSDTIVFLDPTRAGYTFLGWFTDASYSSPITEIPHGSTGDAVVYAKWEAKMNQTVFDANGGVGYMEPLNLTTDSSVYLNANAFTREGYTFAGWARSANGTVLYLDEALYTMGANETYTLYAKWTPNTNAVIFDGNGGNGEMGKMWIRTDGTDVLYSNQFTRPGYTFVGWATSADGDAEYADGANYTMGTESSYTLYAVWKINVNTVVFNANGGTGTMSKMYLETGASATLPENKFTREGYAFVGWATSANGSVVYYGGDTYQMGTSSSYTLYAKWERLSYKISVSTSHASVGIIIGTTQHTNPEELYVPYGTEFIVTFWSDYAEYESLECYVGSTSISNGQSFVMTAEEWTITATSTEKAPSTGSCLAAGTMISLADGSFKPIEQIRVGDKVLSFDHMTGTPIEAEVAFVFFDDSRTPVAELEFSDGSSLTIVNTSGHGMFNATLGQYVLVTPGNVSYFVGDRFVTVTGDGEVKTVELVSCRVYEEKIDRYDVVTVGALNCIANNFLVCSDVLVGVCNTFEFTEQFTYDYEKMQSDIELYGLYSYERWQRYMTKQEFDAFNGAYFKVAVGKGLVTENDIIVLLWFLYSWD